MYWLRCLCSSLQKLICYVVCFCKSFSVGIVAARRTGKTNTVQVTHDDGTFAQYLHLTRNGALVVLGDMVEKGQQIGISGFTGKTGDFEHLHFVVFEYLNADGRKSLPVNFKNTSSNPKGPLADETYEALPFQ